MPKKHRSQHLPQLGHNYVHPSLATTPQERQKTANASFVNEYLQHLRNTQGRNTLDEDLNSSQHAPIGVRQRRFAGPPPPRSWIETPSSGSINGSAFKLAGTDARRPRSICPFPGTSMPQKGSLLHHVLRTTAINIDWHADYDHEYISMLTLEIRYQLLSYVGMYGPHEGLMLKGLKAIFPCEALVETMDDDVKQLDLTGSVGRGLPLSLLNKYWTRKHAAQPVPRVSDSWEEAASQEEVLGLSVLSLKSNLRFPSLARLSLSRPGPHASWSELLVLSRHLGSLTHLALDHWPRPRLPDVASKADLEPRDAAEEASFVLNMLSRNTPSLVWLSLACCHGWIEDLWPDLSGSNSDPRVQQRSVPSCALRYRDSARSRWLKELDRDDAGSRQFISHEKSPSGPEWASAWKHITEVNLSQEGLPTTLDEVQIRQLLRARKGASGLFTSADTRQVLGREPEAYHVLAPSTEIETDIRQRRAKREWLQREFLTADLASKVRKLRRLNGLPSCRFDYGWEKEQALDAGYDEQFLIEVGI